jgi:hypothetical protein
MAHGDVFYLVEYLVGLAGDIMSAIGDVFSNDASDAGLMADLTTGFFGENGGFFYWLNEKLLWMVEQIITGLTFNLP